MDEASRRRALGLVPWSAVAFAVLFLVWVALRPGSADQREVLSDLAFLPTGLAASLAAWAASRRCADPASRTGWERMAAAFLLWWIGDLVWFAEEVLLNQPPFPSPADLAYLAFYPALAWGLLSLTRVPRTRTERLKLGLDAVTVVLAGGMLVWYLVVGPTVNGDPSGLATVLNVAYPVGDLLLLYGVAWAILRRRGGEPALWLLLGGVASFMLADLSYARLSLSDAYAGGDWPDGFWMTAQCLFVLAAYSQMRAAPARSDSLDGDIPSSRMSLLPYAAVVVGYGLLIVVSRSHASYPLNGLLPLAVAITAVVVARQAHVSRENTRLLDEMRHLARTDGLTAILNRHCFFEVGDRLIRRAEHLAQPLAVLMIDVDHFKLINDTFGHAAGDQVLVAVAQRIKAQLRETDVVGRYGGDEVAVVMPDCGPGRALEVAERIRQAVAATPVVTDDGIAMVSLSIGVADAVAGNDLTTLVSRADAGLYEAKRAGRGCTRRAALPA